ncbi:MAG: hypothetical protein WB439_07635 [Acidobacteriaceae bacterium]
MPHQPRVSIGSVLLAKRWLTEEELRAATVKSMRAGEVLEATLVQMGLIDEWQLTSARATQWGYPVMAKERTIVSAQTDLPVSLMRTFSGVPLHHSASAQRVLFGFVYRVEHSLLHAIEQATGFRAEPCFITPSEYRHRMEHLQPAPECRDVFLDDSLTPTEIANKVGDLALEVKARETSFSHCREFAWIRLSSQRRMVNVLFRYRDATAVQRCDILPETIEEVRAFG